MESEKAKLQNLIVMLDERSVSHCHYPSAGAGEGAPMAVATATSVVAYAAANSLAMTLLYPRSAPSAELDACFAVVPCARIVPLSLAARYPGALVVIDRQDWDSLANLPDSTERNIVLRLPREEIPQLPLMVRRLMRKCRRLNLCLIDVESIRDQDFDAYRDRLAEAAAILATEYRQGREFELSALTDRMLLSAMNNCDAGQTHLTVSPDGGLHLCPGFYRLRPGDAVGDLASGPKIPNPELLRLDHAPICSICDAFHCRRCLLLNKQLTLEINTPSRQQCVLSHLERAASRSLLAGLADHEDLKKLAAIPALDYLDPFEELLARRSPKGAAPRPAEAPAKPAAASPGRVQPVPTQPAPVRAAPPRPAPQSPTSDIVVRDGERVITLPRLEPLKVGAGVSAGSPGLPAAQSSAPPRPTNLDTVPLRAILSNLIEQQRAVLASLEQLLKELK